QGGCAALAFGFSDKPPAAGAEQQAFPRLRFVTFLDGAGDPVAAAATGTGATGPGGADHAFGRGNVNARGLHHLDIGDVVDLAEMLFGGLALVPCQAALDVNDDGEIDVTDLITLVQGIFNPGDVTIPPPNDDLPGPGIPGVVVPDGGSIPSQLGCAQGEACL